jgi:hypothetical protein
MQRFDRFSYRGRVFTLKYPLYLSPEIIHGLWVFKYDSLRLYAYAKTHSLAIKALHENFAALWDCIASKSNRELAPDAKTLKAKLRRVVSTVR